MMTTTITTATTNATMWSTAKTWATKCVVCHTWFCSCCRAQYRAYIFSVQFSSVPTDRVVGGTWGMIQQRSLSSLSCRRPLWAVLARTGMSTLWCCPSSAGTKQYSNYNDNEARFFNSLHAGVGHSMFQNRVVIGEGRWGGRDERNESPVKLVLKHFGVGLSIFVFWKDTSVPCASTCERGGSRHYAVFFVTSFGFCHLRR